MTSLLQQELLVVKLKSSLNKNVTTARVPSGKIEVIIKQKRYYSKVTSGKVEVICKQKRYYSRR
jgi:hypothetical protein